MLALLTSCNRPDLLQRTINSLYMNQLYSNIQLIINEDGGEIFLKNLFKKDITVYFTKQEGQHKSIEKFLSSHGSHYSTMRDAHQYYLHLEDDWEFNNSYDWIQASINIMEHDSMVIKVLCRENSPHPCQHDYRIGDISYGYLKPWTSNDSIQWHGFSYNPGVTRLDLIQRFLPIDRNESELAKRIYDAGFKVVELGVPIYKHIGDGRSTH